MRGYAMRQPSEVDMESAKKSLSISYLNGLIKQQRNADFKSIVSTANRSELIKIGGNTLVHMATVRGNISIITFLFSSGFDINAQNEHGQTPLHLAVLSSNFQAVQLLLSLDADILVADSENISSLKLCFDKEKEIPEFVIVNFLERLMRIDLDTEEIAEKLYVAGCPLRYVLLMNDYDITGFMLNRQTSISMEESRVLLECAMNSGYIENVKVLLDYGSGFNDRIELFVDKVTRHTHEPNMKFYFERLIDWDLVTERLLKKVAYFITYGSEEDMQMYLDIGIDEYARKEHGLELLTGLFCNDKIDCLKIVKSRNFDINGRDLDDSTALHKAVIHKNKVGVIYLLDQGADSNIKDDSGETPLLACFDDEFHNLLLEAGADLQVVDNEGKTIFDAWINNCVIAHLCILEAKGLLKDHIKDAIASHLAENARNNTAFNSHREDLEWMRNRYIREYVSLFTLLADEIVNIACHVKNQDDVAVILEASRERELQPNYVSLLTKNLNKALNVPELRFRASETLSELMKIGLPDHLVIEKIISFLSYRDLMILDKVVAE